MMVPYGSSTAMESVFCGVAKLATRTAENGGGAGVRLRKGAT